MSAVMIDAKNVTRNFSISRGMFRGKQILRAVSGVDLTVKGRCWHWSVSPDVVKLHWQKLY